MPSPPGIQAPPGYEHLAQKGDDLVSPFSPQIPQLNVVTGNWEDFHQKPSGTNAEDQTSNTASPVSPVDEEPMITTTDFAIIPKPTSPKKTQDAKPAATSHQEPEGPSAHLIPLLLTKVRCCRCDAIHPALQEYNPQTGEHRALCSTCTTAICTKCVIIDPAMNVFPFKDGKVHLPHLPGAANQSAEYYFSWFCKTCGRWEAIPKEKIKTQGQTISLNFKSFKCEPCQQKATEKSVFVATSTPPTLIRRSIVPEVGQEAGRPNMVAHAASFPASTVDSQQHRLSQRAFTFDDAATRQTDNGNNAGIRSRLRRITMIRP